MFNPAVNTNDHIDAMLGQLWSDKIRLCVDDKMKIAREYLRHLSPWLEKEDDTGVRLPILRYWMDPANWNSDREIDLTGPLVKALEKVMLGYRCRTDRIFVAVACVYSCCLVTNDESDIIRDRAPIRRSIKRWRTAATDFLDTKKAHDRL
jgi:hypothetical protein